MNKFIDELWRFFTCTAKLSKCSALYSLIPSPSPQKAWPKTPSKSAKLFYASPAPAAGSAPKALPVIHEKLTKSKPAKAKKEERKEVRITNSKSYRKLNKKKRRKARKRRIWSHARTGFLTTLFAFCLSWTLITKRILLSLQMTLPMKGRGTPTRK